MSNRDISEMTDRELLVEILAKLREAEAALKEAAKNPMLSMLIPQPPKR